jgi:phospholipid/cholesterol/gamma-HCH transport system substrate-binding protein
VVSLVLDPKEFLAVVRLSVDPNLKLTKETVASIKMNGLLGDKYVDIDPGFDDDVIAPGGRIEHTVQPFDLENAVGQLMFGQTKKDSKDSGGSKDTGGGAPAPTPAPQGGNAPAAPQ